jgi:arabinan endo-1,5-alpha-L-arabinosidase
VDGTVRRNLVIAAAILVVAVTSCADQTNEDTTRTTASAGDPTVPTTATAAVLPAVEGLTGDVVPTHDPDIAEEDGWYYLFLTGEGVPIRRSEDLVHWESVGSVFDEPHPDWLDYEWVEPDSGVGAPDIEWFGGRWHLYYHAHEFATNNAVTGHAWNVTLDPSDPDYDWTDDGLIMSSDTSDDYSVLDANAVVDGDGVPWLSFGSFWLGVQLVELDPDTGAPVPDAPFELLAARDPWIEGIEASSIAYRDGYWYLFVSWGFCCRGVDTQYEIRVGRSPDLAGPYVDLAGRPMLNNGGSLLLGPHGRVIGPGSGDVLVTDDESWLVHHWYDGENEGETTLGVRPLLWSPDGWPIAADNGFVPVAPGAVDPMALEGSWALSQYDPTHEATVDLMGDGLVADGLGTWSFDTETGVVEITIDGDCPALVGTTHLFIVGDNLQAGFGYSDAGVALRAERTEVAPASC